MATESGQRQSRRSGESEARGSQRGGGVGPTYLHKMCHFCIFLRAESGGTGELLAVGWRTCGVPSEREGEVICSQGFTLGWYAVTRWGTQNVTDSNTNSAAPSRCRASSSSERWRDAGVCGCTAGMDRGTRSLPERNRPWDTIPTGQCWGGGLVGAFGHAESVEDRCERSETVVFRVFHRLQRSIRFEFYVCIFRILRLHIPVFTVFYSEFYVTHSGNSDTLIQ